MVFRIKSENTKHNKVDGNGNGVKNNMFVP